MAQRQFLTVAEELLEHAECAAAGFEMRGFVVAVEKRESGQPYTPALAARRGTTRLLVEVMADLDLDRLAEWGRYCRSTGKDVRVAVVIPDTVEIPAAARLAIRDLGVGLYLSAGGALVEDIAPRDLGLNVALPDRSGMSRRVRKLLGPIYDQFDRSNWQEGFGDACTVLEQQARRYLIADLATGRVSFASPTGKPVTFSTKAIGRMPMGVLSEAFAMIAAPNKTDSAVGETLAKLNKDRVGEAHYKGKAPTEKRLRRNVGSHMWTIAEGLKLLCD